MGAQQADRLRQKQGISMKQRPTRPAKREKTELFVKVMLQTLDAPAWRALSHGARSLYVALKRRCRNDLRNNGKIFLSQRQAEIELGSKRRYLARWFRELEFYGFTVMTRPGFLGVEGKGKAPHWRLTELGYKNDPPTRDPELERRSLPRSETQSVMEIRNRRGLEISEPKKQNLVLDRDVARHKGGTPTVRIVLLLCLSYIVSR